MLSRAWPSFRLAPGPVLAPLVPLVRSVWVLVEYSVDTTSSISAATDN